MTPTLKIDDPFNPNGRDARWELYDFDRGEVISRRGGRTADNMNHFDAMRINADHRFEAVVRKDRPKEDMVLATLHDSKFMMAPSTVDVVPALAELSANDFVTLQAHGFKGDVAASLVMPTLVACGDPRAERLDTYVREGSTPDADGNSPAAAVKIDEVAVMKWLESHRPEIHEELEYRNRANEPTYHL